MTMPNPTPASRDGEAEARADLSAWVVSIDPAFSGRENRTAEQKAASGAALLLRRLNQLEAAMKPFADELARVEKVFWAHPEPDEAVARCLLQWGELRRAASLLQGN